MKPLLVSRSVLVLVLLHFTGGTLDVYIDDQVEGGCKNLSSQNVSCPSVENFTREVDYYHSDITIHVPGHTRIGALVVFQNTTNLSIVGESTESKARLLCDRMPSCHGSECAGLQFVDVQLLSIENVQVVGCGGVHRFRNTTEIHSAVFVNRCRDVAITNVDIVQSNHTSLFVENTFGKVFIRNVNIRNNVLKKHATKAKESFAGGIQIFIDEALDKSQYKIIGSHFYNITTPEFTEFDPRQERDLTDWIGYGLGGGLSIVFDGNSTKNEVLVNRCVFDSISAPWGAGMHIRFIRLASQNSVIVKNSFFQNLLAYFGGGGLGIGIAQQALNETDNNEVSIENSTFIKNKALYGAGTYVFAFYGDIHARNKLFFFTNCTWEENEAVYGPAVDISPHNFDRLNTGLLPIPVFKDCNIVRNYVIFQEKNQSESVTMGVFVISRFIVHFEGTLHFEANAFSALLLNSGQVIIQPNSRLTFTNNKGLRGGAISLYSFSSILVSDNCTLEFFNNTATEYGGAIYQFSTGFKEFFAGRSCFLEYNGNRMHETPISTRNISFVFVGNTAPISGCSIFASSFHACYYTYRGSLRGNNIEDFLHDIGNFSFDPENSSCGYQVTARALGTFGSVFINENGNSALTSIPGLRISLPLHVRDELDQKQEIEFFTRVTQNSSEARTNSLYSVNNSVTIYSYPNESITLVVSTQQIYRSIQHSLRIEMQSCPPGYYFDTLTLSCLCSSTNKHQMLPGITRCNADNFTAVLESDYWVGYYKNHSHLYTTICPFEFCVRLGQEFFLPNSSVNLSSFICRPGRKGVVCAECDGGQSLYYHSRRLTCGSEDKCSFGILFYVLSELIPVLIFFTLVTIFDVSFTTGAMNGFVFFSQMIPILPQDFTKYGLEPSVFQSGYNLFYGIFSIDFFSVEPLAFCLFIGATVMDVLAFKYLTVVFALILVMALVLCMHYCTCCSKPCSVMKKMAATSSVLHGLSAFIVICYTECVRVSFFILRKATLEGPGRMNSKSPAIAFYAGIDYLKQKHIPYAIPAIVCLGTIAIIPPVLLLIYPSVLKVLELCKLSEHRLVTATLKGTRINSLMPMFDVFQGCFKDNFRFFAGLYFVYRIALLAPSALSDSLFQYMMATELVLLLVLGIHSTVHPYKLKAHNIIDSLLFLDLAVLNGFTILLLKQDQKNSQLIPLIIYTQLLLIYAPIGVFLTVCVVKLVGVVCRFVRNNSKKDKDESEEFLDHLDNIGNREMRDLHCHYESQ